jgi:hypothetical protein
MCGLQPLCYSLPSALSPSLMEDTHSSLATMREKRMTMLSHSLIDYVSLPKIYAQVKQKTRQLLDLQEKGQPGQ